MLRLFIWKPPASGGPFPHSEARCRSFGTDQFSLRRMLSQRPRKSQYHFRIGLVR
jgi:hypothetical protein